ncbi:hypothetical protein GE21DRAFT_7914 [Neurospora crassa]|uniref:Uncharacterized protein n=1 Tax=Neurospora crassa (strain ATCC 24698 / 74-OR23-1A / CBS 708.71 / DSM 1257 / FGSC 987) TaxID=367110 RepID=Q1K752_NEUCR|nr:hypothetical protein NCU06681 [Neurospora crassa OR74A]EAA31760.2 hypothetical protein NCU06681 [Neurospora crassa OR74A]KHE86962.1 hypothetical protein GE21DRAFT_7914 [Neurospora crassa]|eukprot:XP_960996.2 hypothetical protein NCU06681 [Neurospora crassa OR74A]
MHIYSKPHGIRQGPADASNSLLRDEDDARSVIPEQLATQASLPLLVPHLGPLPPSHPTRASSSSFPASSPSLPPLSRPAAPLPPRLSKTSPSSDSGLFIGGRSRKKRQQPGASPVAFPRFFLQSTQTAVSVIPSIAEGKPFPLDDTSARQKLENTCPAASSSNHRYAKSTGAEIRTYSKPVLVRTRTSIVPQYRRGTSSIADSSRVSRSELPGLEAGPRGGQTGFDTGTSNQSEGSRSHNNQDVNWRKAKNKMSTSDQPENGVSSLPLLWERRSTSSRPIVVKSRNGKPKKLPPMDAFSFKSFMADLQAQGGDNNIGADLDRIAEICARSRYSLSNQYEVHMAPHGSGASLVSPAGGLAPSSSGTASKRRENGSYHSSQSARTGPTLQAIVPDEEEGGARRRRRGPGTSGRRLKSIAYGTLETIMSSSRSSEEDRSLKKPAAEIAGEVRGRIDRQHSNLGFSAADAGPSAATTINQYHEHTATDQGLDVDDGQQGSGEAATVSAAAKLARKKSASFATAVMDNHSRSSAGQLQRYESTCALVSEPALPQTSDSHLGVRTAASPFVASDNAIVTRPSTLMRSVSDVPYQASRTKEYGAGSSSSSTRASWNGWIPWKGGSGGAGSQRQQQQQQQQEQQEQFVRNEAEEVTPTMSAGLAKPRRTVSHAEGSLRRILRSR